LQGPALTRNLELVERLRLVADRHGVSPGGVAVAWVLRHPAVSAAITGFRRPAQVDAVLEAATLVLGPEDLALLG
jgi:aryl-alcohol dehydrogenase-like predicted oxidoreductase